MATDITGLSFEVNLDLSAIVQKAIDLATPNVPLKIAEKVLALTFGTGVSKANQVWWDRRTLAKTASEELDLAGGQTNAFGGTVTFANVKAILVFNRSDKALGAHTATDAVISVGGAAANEFQGPFEAATDAIRVPAGGMMLITNPSAAGWTVTATDADLLKILNKDADDEALYDIVLVGESV